MYVPCVLLPPRNPHFPFCRPALHSHISLGFAEPCVCDADADDLMRATVHITVDRGVRNLPLHLTFLGHVFNQIKSNQIKHNDDDRESGHVSHFFPHFERN